MGSFRSASQSWVQVPMSRRRRASDTLLSSLAANAQSVPYSDASESLALRPVCQPGPAQSFGSAIAPTVYESRFPDMASPSTNTPLPLSRSM